MSRAILLTILSSALLIAAFPPLDIGFLAWVGMVPFFFALDGRKTEMRNLRNEKSENSLFLSLISRFSFLVSTPFLLGLLWGIVFFLGTVYWVVNSMSNYGGVPVIASIFILLLLVVCLSLFYASFGLLISITSSRGSLLVKLLFIPSAWAGIEYIRANMILGGFPWVLLGYSQSSFLPLIQIADITAVYGVSFLIVIGNLFIFLMLSYWLKREKKFPLKEGLVVFVALILVLAYGFLRISQIDEASQNWEALKIGIAQGNIDQGSKWDASFQKKTVEIYKNLSLDLAKQDVKLIVWPETAVPFYLQSAKELSSQIFDVPKKTNTYLLTGSPAYGLGFGNGIKYYNSAFLISPKGEIIGRYDKIHLVPFGEYVPFKQYLPFIHKLVVGVGDFTPGKWLKPLEFNDNSFGVLICFESIFPELARGFIKEGAGFLINMTNDAWFGRKSAPYQHFSQSVFRAVENKVFLVRAANTGISGVIDPIGRVRLKSSIFTTASMVEDIKVKKDNAITFYARYGDVFAIGCIAFVAFIALWRVLYASRYNVSL